MTSTEQDFRDYADKRKPDDWLSSLMWIVVERNKEALAVRKMFREIWEKGGSNGTSVKRPVRK